MKRKFVALAAMLGDIWYTASLAAPEDKYLKAQLDQHNAANSQLK